MNVLSYQGPVVKVKGEPTAANAEPHIVPEDQVSECLPLVRKAYTHRFIIWIRSLSRGEGGKPIEARIAGEYDPEQTR